MNRSSGRNCKSFGALKFLEKAQADGKIVNKGFSFHGSLATFKEIIAANDWTMCQIQYNFLDETLQAGTEGLKYAASQKLAVMVMEPLRGGSLANKLPPQAKAIYDAAPVKRSPAEWGLRWVWNHPEVTLRTVRHERGNPSPRKHKNRPNRPAELHEARRTRSSKIRRRRLPQTPQSALHRMPILHALHKRRKHPPQLPSLQRRLHLR